MKVRKAVFPVAGLGTRLLPASKVLPKEMLPIIDRPLLEFAVEEAIAAGCETLVFVVNRYKHAIADHFDMAYELEAKLVQAGKTELLDRVRDILPSHVRAVFVRQSEALGLGHAVLCAADVVGNEPFAVLLPDDLCWNRGEPVLAQMTRIARERDASVIACEDVPREQTHRYGIVSSDAPEGRLSRMRGVVEKPKPDVAPSTLGIVGRYVLSGKVFDLLERTTPGAGGEIQLTDAIAQLIDEDPVYAYRFEGERFDCGNKQGVVEATIHFALEDPELAPIVRAALAADVKRSAGRG
ncbi:MAG TPA: UTP--glucose-1-phosphate uridylyltransferase GalU [Candidatus Saccharimonadia bacterium]|nr:UTP--glucose-1-phosphate uridylyltransferase GalU [Candidatus Saccharimonadia bacterium]